MNNSLKLWGCLHFRYYGFSTSQFCVCNSEAPSRPLDPEMACNLHCNRKHQNHPKLRFHPSTPSNFGLQAISESCREVPDLLGKAISSRYLSTAKSGVHSRLANVITDRLSQTAHFLHRTNVPLFPHCRGVYIFMTHLIPASFSNELPF